MLIYQAQVSRNTQIFTRREAAVAWVRQNADYEREPYWKETGPECWVLCCGGSGFQVGAVYAANLETSGETDALRLLAFAILRGDPQACDAARDTLKC